MEGFLALGMGSFVLASGVIGIRLLMLARHSRRLPELLMGASLLLQGVFGYSAGFASNAESPVLGMGQIELRCLAATCFNLGGAALAFFHWDVYRPTRRAFGLALLLTIALIASSIGHWALRAESIVETPWWGLGIGAREVCFAWGAFEASRQYVLGRRRERLGLADPLIVNRFLIWTIGTVMLVLAIGIQAFVMATRGIEAMFTPTIVVLMTSLCLVAAASVWLTFLPPGAYVRLFDAKPEPIAR